MAVPRRRLKNSPGSALARRRWAKTNLQARSTALRKTAAGRMTKMTSSDRRRVAVQAGRASAKARKKGRVNY